jgi:hypothetical protein
MTLPLRVATCSGYTRAPCAPSAALRARPPCTAHHCCTPSRACRHVSHVVWTWASAHMTRIAHTCVYIPPACCHDVYVLVCMCTCPHAARCVRVCVLHLRSGARATRSSCSSRPRPRGVASSRSSRPPSVTHNRRHHLRHHLRRHRHRRLRRHRHRRLRRRRRHRCRRCLSHRRSSQRAGGRC